MDIDSVIVAGVLFCYLISKNRRKKRLVKTRKINTERATKGFYRAYFLPMKANDPGQFHKYTRMSVKAFNNLLNMLMPYLKRRISDGINAEERLAITLHYFSQGTTMQTIAWKYHVGHSTVHYIIKETSVAIWEVLSSQYLRPPASQEDWLKIAEEFEREWNFPHCIRALDGKHVKIQARAKSGSLFF
ncbi:uncharacterized protein LOC115888902 [Sitophilus oryzae]|uniref:Uncharacterized protein LOC115888902 n=1 Tax=Sitophilus oryzae TaxID=7048 RepID=A0A6J2YPE3_SITOR|nr:uncharacterized protein LOC115888902 [Sitophilus oryzae]